MIKVAVFLPTIAVGGAEKMITTLVSNYNDPNVKIKLFVIGSKLDNQNSKQLEGKKIDCQYFNKKLGLSFKTMRQVEKSLNNFSPNVIHTNLSAFVYCLNWARKNRVKIVHTIHSSLKRKTNFIIKFLLKLAYQKKWMIPVAISDYIYDEIFEIYKIKNLNAEKIYNPVDLSMFKPLKKEKYKYDFVCVGRFHPIKNHKMLIDAFRIFCDKYPNAKLALAGEGELKKEMEEYSKAKNIEKNIVFLGNVNNINSLLNQSKIFVLSSNSEAFSISILEALACNLPVIATNCGGTKQLVENNGLLVPIGDPQKLYEAMVSLSEDVELQKKFVENAKKSIKKYDLNIISNKYLDLYKKYAHVNDNETEK